MNIDDLTVKQLRELSLFMPQPVSASALQAGDLLAIPEGVPHLLGQKVIIRTYSAGVWFGTLKEKSGDEVVLADARRMWRWWAADSISLSGVALYGVRHDKSKIVAPVASVWLKAIEILELTDTAITSIEGAPDVTAE